MTDEQFQQLLNEDTGIKQQSATQETQQQQPVDSAKQPTEDKGFLGTVVDTVKGAASGIFKEAENTVQAVHDIANAVDNKFLGDKHVDNDTDYDFVPDALKPETGLGKTAQSLSAFATGWIAGGKLISGSLKAASKVPTLAKLAATVPNVPKYVKTAAKGGVVDFITGDGSDERLADVIVDNDLFGSSLAQYLATDADDSLFEGRLKNVIEGFGLGVATDTVMSAFKAMKGGMKTAAKHTVEEAIVNKGVAAEAISSVDEAVAKAGNKWAKSSSPLTKKAAIARQREAVLKDPKAVLEEARQVFNSNNYSQSAKALIDVFQPELAKEFPNGHPSFNEWYAKALETNLANNVDKNFDVSTLIKGTGDDRIDTVARSQWLQWWGPEHVKVSLQKIHEGAEGAVGELRTRAEGILDVLITQKKVNLYSGQVGVANNVVSRMGAEEGVYKATKHATGVDVAVPNALESVSMSKELLKEMSDEDIINAMSSFTTLAANGDADLMTKVVASMAPKGHALRRAFNVPDKPIWDSIYKWRYASMLSSMKTHIRNFAGNSFKIPLTAFEKTVEGAWLGAAHAKGTGFSGMALGALHGARDGLYFTQGLFHGLGQATSTFMDALRYNDAITRPSEFNSLVRNASKPIWGDTADTVITAPLRLLAASDEFFASLSGTANAYQRAMLDLKASDVLKGVTDKKLRADIAARWMDDYMDSAFIDTVTKDGHTIVKGKTLAYQLDKAVADEVTFQQALDKAGQSFASFVHKNPMLKIIFPFVKTPWNITKDAFWTHGVGLPKELKMAFSSGEPVKQAQAMAHLTSASALWLSAYALVSNGIVTGKGPDSKFERDALAQTGYQADSIKMGDKYVSLSLMEPYGSILGFLATEIETAQRDGGTSVSQDALWEALFATVKDKTFMKGLFDVINSAQRGTMSSEKGFPSQVAISFIPGLLRDLGQSVDPIRRDTPDFYSKALDRTPMKEDLAPKVSWLTGMPLGYAHGGGVGAFVNPGITEERQSMLFSELSKLGDIKDPSRTLDTHELSSMEYAEYCQKIATTKIDGLTLYETLDQFVNSDEYRNSLLSHPDPSYYELNEIRADQLKKIIQAYKKKGKQEYASEHRELFIARNVEEPFSSITNF